MAIIDNVKWDGSPNILAWKFPSAELSTWTQLVVNESQEAFVVRGGVYEGPFGAGRHTLNTENLPILRALIGLPFGGQSPFAAEVWFVNRVTNLNLRWGTPDPIQVQDPKYQIMMPVRAFGQYGVRISESKKFLLKLVGTLPSFDASTLSEYFNGKLITKIKTEIAERITNRNVSILHISTLLTELSMELERSLATDISEFGISLSEFHIHSINIPEDDDAVRKLKLALASKAEMGILGFNYQQQRSFDILEAAASNEGNAGGVLGAGLGMGIGVAAGSTMGQAFGHIASNLNDSNGLKSLPDSQPRRSNNEGFETESLTARLQLLRDLAKMKAEGILSEEEFAIEKKRLIGL